MSSAWRWLLGMDEIPAGAESLELGFEHPLPAWGWALVVVAAAAVAWLGYFKMSGPLRWRCMLASIRAALLVWLAIIILGPELVLPRERVERDRVVVLLDRSESMLIEDVSVDGGDQRISRDGQLREILTASRGAFASIAERHDIVWLGFGDSASTLAVVEGSPIADPGESDRVRTRIARAIEGALEAARGGSVSSILIVSDGRSPDPAGRDLVRRLAEDGVPVFAVPLGSRDPLGDLAVQAVEAPARAFMRDEIPVEVRITSSGSREFDRISVRLVDDASGETLAEKAVDGESIADPVVLAAKSDRAGRVRWRVEVSSGESTMLGDLVADNDARSFEIEVIDRPLRVLYIDGYPRWEYRYLKNLLVREPSIESSVMLVSADRDFAQEGNLPLARLPRSPEEFAAYDLIIIGDVPAGFFSPEQHEMMRELVAARGAGLLVVGGPRHAPRSWEDSALAEMLPFTGPSALTAIDRDVSLRPTEAARRLGVLGWAGDADGGFPEEVSDPRTLWARLRWAQSIDPDRLKPAAETLAESEQGDPLLVRMRYGAGQVLHLATDETWRWRYGRGETLQERFWIPLLRLLGRDAIASDGSSIHIHAAPGSIALGGRTTVEVELEDARAMEPDLGSIAVSVEQDGVRVGEIELPRTAPGLHAAAWAPESVGRYSLRIAEPELVRLGGGRSSAEVEVVRPDDEWRVPEADHAGLAALCEATGGELVAPDQESMERLVSRLPDRSVVVPIPIVEPIWSSPFALIVALLLLLAEWIGRRLLRYA
jgi:hypothetical protein